MSKPRKTPRPAASAVQPPPLPLPPVSEEKRQAEARLLEQMIALTDQLRQRNLDAAVQLAQQAARGQGPLIEHFSELGRRYRSTLQEAPRPRLRAIKGGRT